MFSTTSSSPGVLTQFAELYLKARWFVGGGLILISAIYIVFELASSATWALGAAGLIMIAHAGAMTLMSVRSVAIALFVDITATHLGISFLAISVADEVSLALMVVSATVVASLFSDEWIRIGLIVYSTAYVVVSVLVINDWGVDAVDEIIAVIFVVVLLASVVAATRRRLVELEAVRAQTLGVVSHELRNDLAGVMGATELLMDSGFSLDADERSELIELAHQQAVDAGDIIEDLLVASRVERGVLEATPEPVDLVPQTESVILRSASVDGTEVTLDAPDEGAVAIADPLRYRQVLRNLLSNAIRYGGPNIEVSVEAVGPLVSVMVIDDGEGVDPSSAPAIFRPYFRSNDDPSSGSTGLGLWIGRDLARKMGGDLHYKRQDGLTIFELTLPSAPTESPKPRLVDSSIA